MPNVFQILDLNWDIINGHFTSHSCARSALRRITLEASVLTPTRCDPARAHPSKYPNALLVPLIPHFARIFTKSNDWRKDQGQDDSLQFI